MGPIKRGQDSAHYKELDLFNRPMNHGPLLRGWRFGPRPRDRSLMSFSRPKPRTRTKTKLFMGLNWRGLQTLHLKLG